MDADTLAAIGRLWAALTWDTTEATLEHFTRDTCATWLTDNREELVDALNFDPVAALERLPEADRNAALEEIVGAAVVEFVEGEHSADVARAALTEPSDRCRACGGDFGNCTCSGEG
jgi:hypothetical protein